MAPPKKGEPPTIPLAEFAEWFNNHECKPSDPDYMPYKVSLTSLAIMARVSLTSVRNWLIRPGFPTRDANGLVDAYQVWKWKAERDSKLRQRSPRRW